MEYHPKTTKETLLDTINQLEAALENKDERINELEWIERDFTPKDGRTQYFFMIKISPSNFEDDFWIDVSDGFVRSGFSRVNLETAMEAAINHIRERFIKNKVNNWIHNQKG